MTPEEIAAAAAAIPLVPINLEPASEALAAAGALAAAAVAAAAVASAPGAGGAAGGGRLPPELQLKLGLAEKRRRLEVRRGMWVGLGVGHVMAGVWSAGGWSPG
jgi:hypothetical protein